MGFWCTMEIERDRDRKMRAYVQGETDECEQEMQSNETATESALNANEPRDAWEQASWDEAASWEAEDDQFGGSVADEDEEEAFNLTGTQLNEALASERNARRTVAQARAIMHDIKRSRGGNYPQGASKKGSGAGKGKSEGQGKNRSSRGRAPGQWSNASMSQSGTRPHRPMPPSTGPCLKCGSPDHESGKCPKNQEHKSYMAHAMNFTAWCLGSDEMNGNSVTAEVFSCENLARGRKLLDCGATGTVGSLEAIEATIDKSHKKHSEQIIIGWIPNVQPGGYVAHLHAHAQETEGVPVLLSARVMRSFVIWNLEPWYERSPTGRLWMDLFELMPVVSDNPLSLLGPLKSGANVGWMSRNSNALVLVAHNNSCTDSQRAFPSGPTHETDLHDTTTMQRAKGNSENIASLKSHCRVQEIWHDYF